MTLDPIRLCLSINERFGGIAYPGDGRIVIDNTGDHQECNKIKSALQGHNWRDVSFDTLDELKTALPFLSPEGYRFYLPAFMIFSIVDFSRAGIIVDEVVRSLTLPRASDIERIRELAAPPEMQPFSPDEWSRILGTLEKAYLGGEPERVFLERMSGFDVGQRAVIRQFLEYMRDVHGGDFASDEPTIALDRHWEQS